MRRIALSVLLAIAACSPAAPPPPPHPTGGDSADGGAASSAVFTFTEVTASGDRTCATGSDARAYRWGEGIGARPVVVPGLRAITSTRCIGQQVCGLDKYGTITCIGRERRRAAVADPNAPPVDPDAPEKITGLPPAQSFVMNNEGGCAIAAGDLWCWRHARFTDDDFPVVEPVENVHDVVRMHTSLEGRTCVTRKSGLPVCVSPFPQPRYARPTSKRYVDKPMPGGADDGDGGLAPLARQVVEVTKWPDAIDVIPVEANYEKGLCAILANGTTSCNLVLVDLPLAKAASSGHAAAFLDEQGPYVCIKLDSGQARCTEDLIEHASLGRVAESLGPLSALSVDEGHACAIKPDGLYCWGAASRGQLGDGTEYVHKRPVKAPVIKDATYLSVGPELSCVTHKDGALSCWGAWEDERTARARQADVFTPERVAAPFAASSVFVGARLSRVLCATAPTGPMCLFGAQWFPISVPKAKVKSVTNRAVVTEDNRAYQFGWEGDRAVTEPEDFEKAGIRVQSIAADDFCAITPDGDIVCGHCGACNGAEARKVMTRIHGKQRFIEASSVLSPSQSFQSAVCARTVAGTVECYSGSEMPWGRATDMKRIWEKELAGLADVVQISAHGGKYEDNLFCALTKTGDVHCMGEVHHGQLGAAGEALGTLTLVKIADLPPVVQVGTAMDHACARTEAGEVYCWGDNARGGAPDGAPKDRAVPVKVALPNP